MTRHQRRNELGFAIAALLVTGVALVGGVADEEQLARGEGSALLLLLLPGLLALAAAITDVKERVRFCRECGNLTEEEVCAICLDTRRDGGSCEIKQADVDTYNALLVPNAVAWGVGIAGIGAGLVLVLTAPSSKEGEAGKASFVPVPIVVPGGGGMGLSGRF